MRVASSRGFYRHASEEGKPIEDAYFTNDRVGIFGVSDGESPANSKSYPAERYLGGLTSGELVSLRLAQGIVSATPGIGTLSLFADINGGILKDFQQAGRNPLHGVDTGGNAFAILSQDGDSLKFYLGGDAWAMMSTEHSDMLFTAVTQAAFDEGARRNREFAECLAQAKGDIVHAWDLYCPLYRKARIRCANKNLDMGGSATFNGDPELLKCITSYTLPPHGVSRVILGTDGCVPPAMLHPNYRAELARDIFAYCATGNMDALWHWRDRVEAQKRTELHYTGYPEAAGVIVDFV